ncbi:MAG: cupin domain-containing protein [Lentimicrobium sp.]|nr:cupin domain-containing protein [Lentimicrobium sp.]
MKKGNLFDVQKSEGQTTEIFEILADGSAKIERIISQGQISPENEWYDQEMDEWVVLLQGKSTILFKENIEFQLIAGDYLLIPAHQKHRVTYTSTSPSCIWLAIHGKFSGI